MMMIMALVFFSFGLASSAKCYTALVPCHLQIHKFPFLLCGFVWNMLFFWLEIRSDKLLYFTRSRPLSYSRVQQSQAIFVCTHEGKTNKI